MEKGLDSWLLIEEFFSYQFVNNFLALLLWKINCLDFFDTGDFFQVFVISRSSKILIESNFWLGMYVRHILERPSRDNYRQGSIIENTNKEW